MTHHKIKNICYQNASRKILLQNENGPCPLLAVTNILLLRGNLDLPKSCIRDNAVNTSDVITMLANYALSRTSPKDNDHHDQNNQYLLNELMQILPNLQYGLDINPKFTNDVQGYEYTQGVATLFDLLGVDLVHGWLIDHPCHDDNDDAKHDDDHKELFHLIRDKSYNECIEIVIQSNEAQLHYDQIRNNDNKDGQLKDEDNDRKDASENDQKDENDKKDDANNNRKDENYDQKEKDELEVAKDDNDRKESQNDPKKDDDLKLKNDDPKEKDKKDDEKEQDWVKVQSNDDKMKELQQTIKKGKLINDFLTNTSHQLTYYGIHKLQMKLQSENDLKVFFRNNHFSIITKFNDTLYLLITDLGYVNNSTIIWERLDGIDGNTDYYDSFFQLHPANNDYCDVHDVDYQLALQLSTETANHVTQDESKMEGTRAILPPLSGQSENATSNHEDQAYAYALQLQQQEEYQSELLARKLQKEEYENNQRRTARNNASASSAKSSCVIS